MASNIDPSVWGEAGWIFLRNIAKGYPDKPSPIDKQTYKIFYEKVGDVLPCSTCRNNYKKHLKEVPINNYLKDKNSLYKWVNILKVKSKPPAKTRNINLKNNLIKSRIERIKNNRILRAKMPRSCKSCGKR
jgi:hypothetical protein